MADALRLAGDYFSLDEEVFLKRWLPGETRDSVRQTTPESWRTIVESLNNRKQRMIVADDRRGTSFTHDPDGGFHSRANYFWVVACNESGCSAIESANPAPGRSARRGSGRLTGASPVMPPLPQTLQIASTCPES